MVPSIKGTAFESAHADLKRLIAEGRVSREALEARLEAEDLELLDTKLLPGSWYPIGSYSRILDVLLEHEGAGRTEYLVERGARAAERLLASGIYRQLERAEHMKDQDPEDWNARVGNLMVTLSGAIYSFGRWSYTPPLRDGGSFAVEVTEAADFPDNARHTVKGFIAYATNQLTAPQRFVVVSERPTRDHIVFRGSLGA